jgi:hypothetical protein
VTHRDFTEATVSHRDFDISTVIPNTKSLEEVKGLGFDPSRITFRAALIAK